MFDKPYEKKRKKIFDHIFQFSKYGSLVINQIIKYMGTNPNIVDIKIASSSKNFIY